MKGYKCGKEIREYEPKWTIEQQAEYGSRYDGDMINVNICNECFEKIFS